MSYVPLGDGRKDVHVENIELTTNIDGQSRYNYAPPPGGPSDGDSRYSYSGAHLAPQKSAIEKWPINSQQVATLTPLRGSILIFDVLLASCPLLFIILAIVVARLDGKSPLPNTNKLEEMLLYTPTVFPLLFAALMGRFFRHLGLWLAERGTTLGRLEQLVGCQLVFLAIERQICLRNFSIVGVCSILVWLLSPFGGQSALRVLRQETRYLNTTQTYHYLDPLNVEESVMGGASAINSGRSTFTPLFLAALLSSADFQVKPADLWGNVKLPSYRAIENTTAEEWKSVPSYKDNTVKWSSLIGIPVSAFNGQDFTAHSMNHFTVKARQFDISCTSNAEISRGPSTNASWPTISPWRLETAIEQPKNCTDGCKLKGCDAYPCPFNSTSMTDTGSDTETASRAECEYSYEYVEASVECIGSLCRAISMRKLDMYTDGYSEDSDDFVRGVVMYNLMTTLSSVDTIGVAAARVRGSTNMEAWLMDPENFIGATGGVNVDLYQLPVDVFADRLTILWNTFFQATYASRALAGNLDKATSMNITDNLGANITFNSTQSLVSQRVDVYRVNWRWFSVLLGCSLVLLCAAYAGLVLKYLSIAPDIVGYASSLTLLSPYVPTPTGGTTLHGLERTALLHNLPIRLGDVCPNDPVGAIALAANDGRVVGLDRRRQYI